MSSGLPLEADITQYSRHVSKVPQAAVAVLEARVRPVPATTYRQPRHYRHAFVGG